MPQSARVIDHDVNTIEVGDRQINERTSLLGLRNVVMACHGAAARRGDFAHHDVRRLLFVGLITAQSQPRVINYHGSPTTRKFKRISPA
jgi:hypothetical protein